MNLDEKIEALDEQIPCGSCDGVPMRALAVNNDLRPFVSPGEDVALVCPACQYTENGSDRL